MADAAAEELRETPLAALHRELGGAHGAVRRLFHAGAIPDGIIAEHNQVRSAAGLFDVSHMGQASSSVPTTRRPRGRWRR